MASYDACIVNGCTSDYTKNAEIKGVDPENILKSITFHVYFCQDHKDYPVTFDIRFKELEEK